MEKLDRELVKAEFTPEGETHTKMVFEFDDKTAEVGYLDNVSMKALIKNALHYGTFNKQ